MTISWAGRGQFYQKYAKYSLHIMNCINILKIQKSPKIQGFVVLSGIYIKLRKMGLEPMCHHSITLDFTAFLRFSKNCRGHIWAGNFLTIYNVYNKSYSFQGLAEHARRFETHSANTGYMSTHKNAITFVGRCKTPAHRERSSI